MLELNRTKEDLYKEGCPIVIKSATINTEDDVAYANLNIKSISNTPINSVMVDLHIFDKANIEIEVVREHLYLVENLERDTEFGGDTFIELSNSNAFSISVAIRRVIFSAEEEWTGSSSILFENIPARIDLESYYEDKETKEQFQRDFSEKFAENKEVLAKVNPLKYKDLWVCSCEAINHSDEEICHVCGASYEPQREHIDNRILIETNLAEHKKNLADEAERVRLENVRKIEEAQALKEKAEREALEEKERFELEQKKKKRTRIIAISIAVPALIIVAIYIYLLNVFIIPNQKYDEATKLLEEKNFVEAIAGFEELGDFEDSKTMVVEAKFLNGQNELENKNYDNAIKIFNSIAKDKDVKENINEVNYKKAVELFEKAEFENAIEIFTSIESFENSKEYIDNANCELAILSVDDLKKSAEYFAKITGKLSTKVQELYFEKGEALYSEEDYANADSYFSYVTDSAIAEKVDQIHYDKALVYIQEKNYEEAISLLKSLGDFSESKNQLKKIDYLKGEEQLNLGETEKALEYFESAGDFEGANDKVLECKYNLAYRLYNIGDYQNAADAFEEIRDYADSESMRTVSLYNVGYSLLDSGDAVGSYEVLHEISDYSPAYKLLVNDWRYYVYVYNKGLGTNPLDA